MQPSYNDHWMSSFRNLMGAIAPYHKFLFKATSALFLDQHQRRTVSMLDPQTLRERIQLIENKRESLLRLLEQPDLGTLRIDVNQALEEIDDLIDEFKRTFPESELN